MIRGILLLAAGALLLAFGAFAVWVRIASTDPAGWHVDPATAPSTGRPNEHRASATFDAAPADVMQRLDAVATAEPRARRIAGSPAEGHVTYMTRSPTMGFPDYTSARVESEGDGTRLHLYARARFGYSDMGANEARVERWLSALAP